MRLSAEVEQLRRDVEELQKAVLNKTQAEEKPAPKRKVVTSSGNTAK